MGRFGYVKDENGELKRKYVSEEEHRENPEILYKVRAGYASYAIAHPGYIEEVKADLLEQMIETIRNLAKLDKFWEVTTLDDHWNNYKNGPMGEMHPMTKEEFIALQSQEMKDGGVFVGWEFNLPNFEGIYKRDEADELNKKLDDAFVELYGSEIVRV